MHVDTIEVRLDGGLRKVCRFFCLASARNTSILGDESCNYCVFDPRTMLIQRPQMLIARASQRQFIQASPCCVHGSSPPSNRVYLTHADHCQVNDNPGTWRLCQKTKSDTASVPAPQPNLRESKYFPL